MTEPAVTSDLVDVEHQQDQNSEINGDGDKGGDVLDGMPFGWYIDGAVDPADSQRWREVAEGGGDYVVSAQEVLSAITAVLHRRAESEKQGEADRDRSDGMSNPV